MIWKDILCGYVTYVHISTENWEKSSLKKASSRYNKNNISQSLAVYNGPKNSSVHFSRSECL